MIWMALTFSEPQIEELTENKVEYSAYVQYSTFSSTNSTAAAKVGGLSVGH